jgi:hypothetical protein
MVRRIDYSHENKEKRKKRLSKERVERFRARKREREGRKAFANGRPPLLTVEENDYINSRVFLDSSKGIFHQMKWLMELVKDLNIARGFPLNKDYSVLKSWGYNYIKKNPKLCLRKPTITERKRILNCTRPNLERFYTLVASKYKQHNYFNALKFNLDETPLLVKHPISASVIVSNESLKTPVEPPVQFIFKCSALPVVSSDGTHICSAIIFPEGYDLSPLKYHFRPNYIIYQTKKGSMTKNLFEKFMKEEVLLRIPFFFF